MCKKYLFFLPLLFYFFVFAEEKVDPYITASISSEPTSIVGGCVNAITGDFVFSSMDLVAQGEEPITLNHIYTSRYRKHSCPGGLLLSEHLYIVCDGNVLFKITEPSGIQLLYSQPKYSIKNIKEIKAHIEKDITLELTADSLNGLSNASDLSVSGRLNLKNNKVVYNQKKGSLIVFSSNGSTRYYKDCKGSVKDLLDQKHKNDKSDDYYREFAFLSNNLTFFFKLEKERLSNGNWIIYEYDGRDFPIKIYSTNPNGNKIYSSIDLRIDSEFLCTTSCNKILKIQGDILKDKINQIDHWSKKKGWKNKEKERIKAFIYKSKISSENPDVNFNYLEADGKVITDKILPDGRILHIDYYTIGDHYVNNTKIHISNKEDLSFMRVKSISVPNKENNALHKTYSFIYHLQNFEKNGGKTEVYDCDNNKTVYSYSKELRLESIHHYLFQNNQYSLKNFQKLIWGKNLADATFLLGRIFYDSQNKPIFAKRYFYDDKGNLIKEALFGNLSGKCKTELVIVNDFPKENGIESFTKERVYDQRNLLLYEKDDSGLITSYLYQNDTDKMTAGFISYKSSDQIKQRTFYSYDEDNILVEEIQDNGSSKDKNDLSNVTKRIKKIYFPKKTKPYGLIDKIEIYYLDVNQEKFLRAENFEYNSNRKVTKRQIFGSDGKFKYELKYCYDEKGNISYEKDPIEREAFYKYDLNNNKIEEIDFSEKKLFYKYDKNNRLTKRLIQNSAEDCAIEDTSQRGNNCFFEEYEYDLKNNLIAKTNIHGNIARFEYDIFGNVVKEIFPAVQDTFGNKVNPEILYIYDDLGRQIEKIDPLKNKTTVSNNANNKPTQIKHADAAIEEYTYNLDGTLQEYVNQEGTITRYEYDYLKRVVSKQILSSSQNLLREEFFNYDTFDLTSKVDSDGNITKYTYDLPSRVIKEEFFNKDAKRLSIKEFYYDELGFINKKIEGDELVTKYKRDNVGRILKESVVKERNFKAFDLFVTELSKVEYEYDKANNKISIISNIANRISIEKRNYDLFNRLIKIIDANKNITSIIYEDFLNDSKVSSRKTHINAINQKTVTSFDALNREISIEQINPQNQRLSLEEKFYDLNGNLTRQLSTIYNPDKSTRQVVNYWQYDDMNRLISLKEAFGTNEEKTTNYTYTPIGNLKVTIKPDGVELKNEYDPIGNKTRLYSSDKSVSYEFTYNNINQLIEAKDNIQNKKTIRNFDALGNLLEENLSNNLKIKNEYNLLGNRTKCIFSDGSFVEYTYDPLNLKQVIRKDKDGLELYKHEFLKYDLSGNLLKEKLIQNSGIIDYELDLLAQITKINHDTKNKANIQSIAYDKIGRISNIKHQGLLEDFCEYKYDDLNQVIQETGLFSNDYEFDSNYNRLKKNDDSYQINNLNEILSTSNEKIIYDKNGNPIQRTTNKGEINYFYDALDRLIKIEKIKDYIFEFTYDPFNRRISERLLKYSYVFGWQEQDFRFFLYDNQNEIGSYDQNLKSKELRILSDTKNAEIGSSIAFEIEGKIYAPVHDVCGSVNFLFSEGNLQEHYRYSAFGERKIFSSWGYEKSCSQVKNPWQYSSKRIDEESGLIYFGRRYYDPSLGRWLTPDPKGFVDSINLYVYVLNDPLINVDLYGLYLYTNPWIFPKTKFNFNVPAPNCPPHGPDISALPKIFKTKDPAEKFDLSLPELTKGRIFFQNGINCSKSGAEKRARMLSQYAGGVNIHVNYNETRGFVYDLGRSILELKFAASAKAVNNLKEQWYDFFSQDDENCALQFCHSEGVIIVRNALDSMDKKVRKRIIVVAIAPAALIDKRLCHSVHHYISKREFVHFFDAKGWQENFDTITVLDPHPNAKLHDHKFNSPTFQNIIKARIEKYINNPGGI